MTDQNAIPAEKVRELIEKFEREARNFPSEHERVVSEFSSGLRALLPTPPQPTTGLLGRWAKHDDYGDVLCMWDRPDPEGKMHVRWVDESFPMSTGRYYVPLSDLTFPEQATKPEDVPAGEAWLVDVEDSEESHKSIVALKYACDDWRTSDGVTNCSFWEDTEVTLLAPLTPERPGKDDEGFLAENERILAAYSECAEALQARYDELDKSWCYLDGKYSTLREDYDALEAKYREAQEKIEALSQALDNLHAMKATWRVCGEQPDQPAWRIEHDPDNLRKGEYIIDRDDYDGTVTHGASRFAPFIVFPNRSAATLEAIEEAKRARDKEMGK